MKVFVATVVVCILWPQLLGEPLSFGNLDHPRLVYWNVGQGDFISFISPSVCLAFDVGGSFKIPMRDLLILRQSCPQHRLELFVSHFDRDHIINYRRLMTYLKVPDAYFSHLDTRSSLGNKFLEHLKNQNSQVHVIGAGWRHVFGETQVRCLWPKRQDRLKSENDHSLVLDLSFHKRHFLFTGDLPAQKEKKFLPQEAQILKVGHHGSRTSSSLPFLKSIRPHMCIVSVGKRNTYGHPNRETLQRLSSVKCAILRTDRLGDITVEL